MWGIICQMPTWGIICLPCAGIFFVISLFCGIKRVCQTCFAVTLVVNMLWGTLLIKIVSLMGLPKKSKEGMALMITRAMWRAALILSPWMWCTTDARSRKEWSIMRAKMAEVDAEAASGSSKHKPLMMVANHTSFFDTFIATCWGMPAWALWRARCYMDSSLFKIPLLSTICHGIGHFPVHFTSSEDGKFTVDKEKNEQVDQRVGEHLSSGGFLCFFPEGQINKDPDVLMQFRFGGMKKALETDARLIALVTMGNEKVWPRSAKVGGFPGVVRYSSRCIAPDGARAFVAELRARADVSAEDKAKPDHELLAVHTRLAMQRQYDELKTPARGGRRGAAEGVSRPLLADA